MTTSGRTYDDDRVQAICTRELQNARGFQSDEIEANREQALAYYLVKPRGDEVEGLSKVQSSDVADMTEAVISFLAPALGSQSLVQFAAVGADDEDQAAKESRIVQALVRSGRSNAYVSIQEAAKDALLLRNGILKAWVDEDSDVTRERYALPGDKEGPDLAMLAGALGRPGPGITREIASSERQSKAKGGQWLVTVKQTVTTKQLRMAAVDPCNFFYSPEAAGMDVEQIRFIAERQFPTRGELLEEGIAPAVVRNLPAYFGETRMDAAERRRVKAPDVKAEDFWQQQIEVFRCYVMLGTGEGGRGERWLVSLAHGRKVIAREKVKCVPYAVGAVIFAGHQFQGISLFDKLRETQDTKTGFLREWLNNAQLVNKPRAVYIEGAVNEDDLHDVRVGGTIKATARDSVAWLTTPDIGQSCIAGLDYQDKMRSERGGASLEMLKPGLQLNSPTATGTERELSVKEQLAALFGANLAQTLLRGIYLVCHKLLRYEMPEYVSAQDGGQWLEDQPQRWREREDVAIVIGLSPGERLRRMSALQAVIGEQEKILQSGLGDEVTSLAQLHTALVEWTRASGLDAPEKYWMDPNSREAQQARAGKEQKQRALGSAQAELLTRVRILEAQVDTYKVQLQEAGKYWAEVIRAEVEEMKVVGTATAGLEAAKIGAVQRSGSLTAAAEETTRAAGANAAKPIPPAGTLPPGSLAPVQP